MGDVERRKFARGRGAVGSAAAIREAVVKDLRESSVLVWMIFIIAHFVKVSSSLKKRILPDLSPPVGLFRSEW